MSGFLMDTCAVSEIIKKRPDGGLAAWVRAADPLQVFISVVTLGEIRKGVELCADIAKKSTLETWLTTNLSQQFAGRILAFDAGVADRWGRLLSALHGRGVVPAAIDSLIAATALEYNLSVVTRNAKDFEHMGVGVINPWKQ